jgi:ureidoglycolate lyase
MLETERSKMPAAPAVAPGLRLVETPLVQATAESLAGYGQLVSDPDHHAVEIVRWPAKGWRQVDSDTGDQGGTTEGAFSFWWKGEVLYGRNDAVGDAYLLGWSEEPARASEARAVSERSRLLLWHANYHPDGGQLFFPLDGTPFVVPLALPGDDLRPEQFKSFYFDGSCGLYIHPGIWHEGVFPLAEHGRFFDKQGKVHARISCDFPKEFDCLLAIPLRAPD